MTQSLCSQLENIVRCAAQEIISANTSVSGIIEKEPLDYVTSTDLALDNYLTDALNKLLPGVPVYSEERPFAQVRDTFWIIDPLDGTQNFIFGLPFFSIAISLCDTSGPLVSCIWDIHSESCYKAERGKGAFNCEKRLFMPSKPSELIALSSGAIDMFMTKPHLYKKIRETAKIRNIGSQALQLCYVAEGRFQAAISDEARFWDDAAGSLIAMEAGACYYSLAKEEFSDFSMLINQKTKMQSICCHPDVYQFIIEQHRELYSHS